MEQWLSEGGGGDGGRLSAMTSLLNPLHHPDAPSATQMTAWKIAVQHL
jgi:hypothetical protein